MCCELSWLIVCVLMICHCLNIVNISTLSGCSICEQWKDIISKSMLFYIQYTIKSAWIWLLCPSVISNYCWFAVFLHIKGLKTLINQYKSKLFKVQLFLDIIKYQLSGISSLIYCIFIYSSLNIKVKIITLPVILIHLISIIYSCFLITTLYFYILLRCISTFIACFLPMPNPDSSIFHIFERS